MFSGVFLKDRALISLFGEGIKEFLQGILTNDINNLKDKGLLYSLMLTPQGKFLYDFFLWQKNDKVFIDCLSVDRDEIIQKLNLYKLGKDIEINPVEEYGVLFVSAVIPGFVDPRFPNHSSRIYLEKDKQSVFLEKQNISIVTDEYSKFLCDNVLPDASYDMIKGRSFPLEYGMDNYNAISFDKGCYVGQELVARTKYRGTIRKKIYGISLSDSIKIQKGEEVIAFGQSIGIFCSSYKGRGKALLRKDYVEELRVKSSPVEAVLANFKIEIL